MSVNRNTIIYMTYNLHPIIVHFPIALLFLYSLINIIPTHSWFPKITWKPIERFLLVVGTIGIFLAKSSGEMAENLTQSPSDIVKMHEVFANATTWFYIALVVIEFLPVVIHFMKKRKIGSEKIHTVLNNISNYISKKWLIVLLSLLGLLALFVTGLLGGAIVYGSTADPLAPIILKLLGL